MNSYQILETLILCCVFGGSLWLALRKAAPRLSLVVGELARKAGMSEALSTRIFGAPAACNSGCGSCGGCEKPAQHTARISFQRKH